MNKEQKKNFSSSFLESLLAISLVLLTMMVIIQVILRYVLHFSIPGVEELARLIFVWACFFGIGLSAIKNDHMAVDVLLTRLPPAVQKYGKLINSFLMLGTSLVMIIAGTKFVAAKWVFPDYNTVLLYPRMLFWLPVPICGLIIFVFTLSVITKTRRGPR